MYVTNKMLGHRDDVNSHGSGVYWTRDQYLPERNKKTYITSKTQAHVRM
jgi:hypothetical protein